MVSATLGLAGAGLAAGAFGLAAAGAFGLAAAGRLAGREGAAEGFGSAEALGAFLRRSGTAGPAFCVEGFDCLVITPLG